MLCMYLFMNNINEQLISYCILLRTIKIYNDLKINGHFFELSGQLFYKL